jgi:hypothetical protein
MAAPTSDGWHDLPSGGAVELKDGVPVRITDKGNGSFDENKILAEAAELTECKLTWSLDRATRWRRNSLLSVFRRGLIWSWCLARVLRDACELCGNEVGVRWMKVVDQQSPGWVGEDCARDSDEVER